MPDFLSTRENTDPQSARCARLIAAIIAQAIKDASDTPLKEESDKKRNMNDAAKAMKFLFGKNTLFPLYASLIGLDAKNIRENLLGNHKLSEGPGLSSFFKESDRRIIKIRHVWFNRLEEANDWGKKDAV